jgi:glycosyltransferase involved in cell wall biosynthesis
MPRVTVCLAVYNGADTLPEALQSVRSQTYTDYDVLVLDDGSADESPTIAERFGARVVRQQNQGLGAGRKRLVEEASGDLIAFIDHDDAWVPDKLEKQLALLDETGAALVHSDAWYHYTDGRIVDRDLELALDSDPLEHIVPNNLVIASSAVFDRAAMLHAGNFVADTVRCSDWYGWFLLASQHRFAHLREKQVKYIVQATSLANTGFRFYEAQHYLLTKKILPRFDELYERLPKAQRDRYRRQLDMTVGTAASGMAKYLDQQGKKAEARELHRLALAKAGLKPKVVMRAIKSYLR